jgi:hypothetical protein
MKATITPLWDTGREIICYDNDEFKRPQSFEDLNKCDNVLIGDKIEGTRMREVLIDNNILIVDTNRVRHPMGGVMYILEVYC